MDTNPPNGLPLAVPVSTHPCFHMGGAEVEEALCRSQCVSRQKNALCTQRRCASPWRQCSRCIPLGRFDVDSRVKQGKRWCDQCERESSSKQILSGPLEIGDTPLTDNSTSAPRIDLRGLCIDGRTVNGDGDTSGFVPLTAVLREEPSKGSPTLTPPQQAAPQEPVMRSPDSIPHTPPPADDVPTQVAPRAQVPTPTQAPQNPMEVTPRGRRGRPKGIRNAPQKKSGVAPRRLNPHAQLAEHFVSRLAKIGLNIDNILGAERHLLQEMFRTRPEKARQIYAQLVREMLDGAHKIEQLLNAKN